MSHKRSGKSLEQMEKTVWKNGKETETKPGFGNKKLEGPNRPAT